MLYSLVMCAAVADLNSNAGCVILNDQISSAGDCADMALEIMHMADHYAIKCEVTDIIYVTDK